jgi:predicted  nucleic acid-binding Zn-ribbon protein
MHIRNISPFLLIALLGLLMLACGEKKDPVVSLQQEVMAVHDEVMPKMGEIAQLEKSLRKERERLAQLEMPDSTQMEVLLEEITTLKRANEGMMDWMRNYEAPSPEQDQAESIAYLNDQMEKIEAVKTDMMESIEHANTLLK